MATEQQLLSALRKAHESGDARAANRFAEIIKEMKSTPKKVEVSEIRSPVIDQLGQEVEQLKMSASSSGGRKRRGEIASINRKTRQREKLQKLRAKNPYLADLVEETTPMQALGVGFIRGMRDIPRAFGGFKESDFERQSMDALEHVQESASIGRAGGQAAPFAPLGFAAGGISSLPARAAVTTGLGASEGALISAGMGGSNQDVLTGALLGASFGLGGEVALPVLNRVAGKIKGAFVDQNGSPTPEAVEAFASEGVDISGTQADQGVLEELGIRQTLGERTQDFEQQKLENMLTNQASEAGDIMRNEKLAQSREISDYLDNVVDDDAVQTEEFGEMVKESLKNRKSEMKATRKDAYNKLADATETVEFPLDVGALERSIPDAGELRDFAATNPTQHRAMIQLGNEFGVDLDGNINPENIMETLTVGNAERFRKRLNNIESTDQTGATSRFTGPLKRALDEEFDMASSALQSRGSESAAQAAKEARDSHIALKTEFDEKGIVDRLSRNRKRSNLPEIEDSQVYKKLVAPSVPVEQFTNVVNSLGKTSGGKKAINQIKAQMIMDMVDSGFSAKSRKVNGERIFGATPFINRFDNLEPKLRAVMSDAEFKRLERFRKGAESLIPPNESTLKGSAGFFVDALEKMGMWTVLDKYVPGIGAVISQSVQESAKKSKDLTEARKAVSKPEIEKAYEFIGRDYPSLATALGIAYTVENEEDTN